MQKKLNNIFELIEKIGKQNILLIIFIVLIIIITSLYQTFSLYTESEGVSTIDGIKTYKFILDSNNETNAVTVASGSSKNVAITISNPNNIQLLYGLYYSSSSSLDNVNVGYKTISKYPSSGLIKANQDYIIDCRIYNASTDNITINLGVKYGFEKGGELSLETGEVWIEEAPIVVSETSGVATFYDSLSAAVSNASTTASTTITLLENTTEDILNENLALYDTVIDLNSKTLNGSIYNSNADSTMTIKNGTVENSTTDKRVFKNLGTMNILSGNYINHVNADCIYNSGTMTIDDGYFRVEQGNGTSTIFNASSSTLTMNGGTIDTTTYGVVNTGATVTITGVDMTTTNGYDVLNRNSGTTKIYSSTLSGSGSINNQSGTVTAFWNSGSMQLNAAVTGVVYAYGWHSTGKLEWRVYGKSDGACATWTDYNGQDDIKWVTMSSYTSSYSGTYLFCYVLKSDHKNESGTYYTHIYNAAHSTFYYGTTWSMP